MTKQDIIDYVVTTPHNPNKAVLSTMLDSFEAGDNKQEIELLAEENKVYTPATGQVYNKVTVNVPEIQLDTLLDTITLTENGSTNAQTGRGFKTVNVNVPDFKPTFTLAETEESGIYTLTCSVNRSIITSKAYGMCTLITPGHEDHPTTAFFEVANNVIDNSYMLKGVMITYCAGNAIGNEVDYNSYPLMFRSYCAIQDRNDVYLWHLKSTDIRTLGSLN